MPPTPLNLKTPLVLSLDGGLGGGRGLSILTILMEINHRAKYDMGMDPEDRLPRPLAKYFHLIGGTGTGGVFGLMLDTLGMHVEDAYTACPLLIPHLEDTFTMYQGTTTLDRGTTTIDQRTANLVEALKNLVKKTFLDHSDQKLRSGATTTTFVCSQPSMAVNPPRLFRTYNVRDNQSYNCTIWEAAQATTATPDLFSDIEIGGEKFIGGGLGCNNPIYEVLSEAKANPDIDLNKLCVLSIGSGHPGVLSAHNQPLSSIAVKVAFDCEETSRNFEGHKLSKTYIRLNVTHALGYFAEDWIHGGEVSTSTAAYLHSPAVGGKIDTIVDLLKHEVYDLDSHLFKRDGTQYKIIK